MLAFTLTGDTEQSSGGFGSNTFSINTYSTCSGIYLFMLDSNSRTSMCNGLFYLFSSPKLPEDCQGRPALTTLCTEVKCIRKIFDFRWLSLSFRSVYLIASGY